MRQEYHAQQSIRKQQYLSQDQTDQCMSSTAIKLYPTQQKTPELNFPLIDSATKKNKKTGKRGNRKHINTGYTSKE